MHEKVSEISLEDFKVYMINELHGLRFRLIGFARQQYFTCAEEVATYYSTW